MPQDENVLFEPPEETGNDSAAQADEPRSPAKRNGRTVGAGSAPHKELRPSSNDADQVWLEVLKWSQKQGLSAYDFQIRVIRTEPPPHGQVASSFEASAIMGDVTTLPGDALTRYVRQYYHAPYQEGPGRYEIQFLMKGDQGRIFCRGYMRCPSRREIEMESVVDRARQMAGSNQAPGAWTPPGPGAAGAAGVGAPPTAQPQWPWPPYMTPPQPPQPNLEIESLKGEMRELTQLVRGLAAQQIHAPPPPSPPPQPTQPLADLPTLITSTIRALVDQGIIPSAPPVTVGVGAPPQDPSAEIKRAVDTIKHARSAYAALHSMFGDDGDDDDDDDDGGDGGRPPPTTVVEKLGLREVAMVDMGTTWRDGRPVKAPIDPETGEFRFDQQGLIGLALGNPIIGETAMDVIAVIKERMLRAPLGPGTGTGAPPKSAGHDIHVEEVPNTNTSRHHGTAPPDDGTGHDGDDGRSGHDNGQDPWQI